MNRDIATVQKSARITNGVNVDDLVTTIASIRSAPATAQFQFRVHNQWAGASQNGSTVDNFRCADQELSRPKPFVLRADEPVVLLGKDMAANPVEHLLHALAACLTTSMVYYAAARDIHIEEVQSSLEGDVDLHGFLELDRNIRPGCQAIRVNFKVKADVPDEQLRALVELGTSHSPVFDSLTRGVPISVRVERP